MKEKRRGEGISKKTPCQFSKESFLQAQDIFQLRNFLTRKLFDITWEKSYGLEYWLLALL